MKKTAFPFLTIFISGLTIFFSCDKRPVISNPTSPSNPTNPLASNKTPSANAGQDILVSYDLQTCKPTDTIILNGSNSFDPDGMIVSYIWRGPGLTIPANSSTIKVNGLAPGMHQYILLVTDDKGASGTDTVTVSIVSLMNRAVINAELVPFGILSQQRSGVVTATAGNKILFAGGDNYSAGTSTRVDIYDMNTNSWSIAELSKARYSMAVAVLGTKIFFAGGAEGNWWDGIATYSIVDIYDASTNSWSVANLSEARGWIAAASVGNKVFFAGGFNQNYFLSGTVDIYDIVANSWSTASLSLARHSIVAESINNKIYFAGGVGYVGVFTYPSAAVDIFDNSTGMWSVSAMSEPKTDFQSISIGNKIIWAGGNNSSFLSNNVEIKDVNTQSSSLTCLCQPMYTDHGYQKAVSDNNKILFLPGNVQDRFDIYDMTSNKWFIGKLNKDLHEAAVISVNNTIYIAAGYVNGSLSNQVWKLEY